MEVTEKYDKILNCSWLSCDWKKCLTPIWHITKQTRDRLRVIPIQKQIPSPWDVRSAAFNQPGRDPLYFFSSGGLICLGHGGYHDFKSTARRAAFDTWPLFWPSIRVSLRGHFEFHFSCNNSKWHNGRDLLCSVSKGNPICYKHCSLNVICHSFPFNCLKKIK